MVKSFKTFSKTFILTLIVIVGICSSAKAQLLQWNTFGNAGTETTEPSVFNDPNISAANLTQGAITAAANANRFGGSAWSTGGTSASAVTGNDYIEFIVTPNATCSVTPTSFVFNWQSSGTGPTSVALRSSADAFAADLGTQAVTGTITQYTITISGITNYSSALTFRLYGYGASAGTGTGGIDIGSSMVDVQLNGTTSCGGGCTAPTTQASSFSASGITSSGMTLNWTSGNGDAGRIVVVRAGGAVNADPSSGTAYTANTTFGSGSQIGTGNYVVYNNTGNSVAITGLSPNTTYHVAVYEYNATGTCYNLTELTGNATTLCDDPTTQASAVNFTSVTSTGATINFTGGNGTNALVVVKATSAVTGTPTDGTSYTANTTFGSGGTIAASEYVVYANTGSSVAITGLTANTTYSVAVFEYNSASNCYQTTSPATGSFITNSSTSDIITANGESATISSIINTAGPLTSAQGTQVWQFTIRDGGASSPDADNLATIVNSIVFSSAAGDAVADWSTAIQSIDLFDGVTNVGTGVVTATTVTFSGLTISVTDNSTKTISVRLTLKCGFGATNFDGDDFGFQISNGNVTFDATGSGKNAFGAISTTNGQNVIAVVATQLAFTQQPTSSGQNQTMAPAVTVTATDACGNKDLGYTGTVSLTSTGTMTGTPLTSAAVAGVATFSGIIHTVVGTGYTLSATATGLTGASSSTFDIFVVTTFTGGDMAIVGMCVNQGACGGAAGEDEISIVSFVDITPGTSFYITDNGYERVGCGSSTWGDGEGVVQITRTTSTVTAGTILTFRIMNNTVFSGLSPDNNWTIAYTVGTNFNLNNNDEQVYLMQGGTWTNPGAASDATYSGGTFMFAINTYTAWSCNDNTTTRGDLPVPLKCLSVLPLTGTVNVKYTGAVTPATQKDWIDRLNSIGNWSSSTDCPTYNGQSPNYSGGYSFTISPGGFNSGYWTGALNTDWFDCNNWQNFKVPDSLANVTIDNVANDPIIGASPALYPGGAICNDMLITSTSGAGILTLNNALSYLSIKGSVTNNGTITGTLGNVEFRSAVAQTFGGAGSTSIYRMYLKNSHASSLSLTQDITVTDLFTFTTGILNTGTNKLIITNTTVPTIAGYGSTKFINGNLRQSIANNTSTYILPLGYSSASTDYHPANFINGNIVGPTYIDTYVNSITEAGNNIDSRIVATQSGVALTDAVNTAEWNITPSAAATAGTYGVDLYVTNIAGLTDDQFFVVKRDNTSTDYADWNTYDGTTFIPVAGSAGRITSGGAGFATRVNFSSFSKFVIAKGPPVFILPIELISFTGKREEQHITLEWKTSQESNVSYFEIQKSKDAKVFEVLGTVSASTDGKGSSYFMNDENPEEGINYYKLFSIDNDGKRIYQKTISVNYLNDIKDAYTITYTDDKVLVSFKEVSKQTEVGIYSLTGQLVKEFFYGELMNGMLVLNNSDFAKGMYILRVGQKFSSSSDKIIIR